MNGTVTMALSIGVGAATGMLVLAQGTGIPLYDTILQASGMALLGLVCLVLLIKVLPAQNRAISELGESVKLALDAMRAQMGRWEESRHADSKELVETLTRLAEITQHCRDHTQKLTEAIAAIERERP